MKYHFEAPLWKFQGGKVTWYFVSLPKDIGAEIAFFNEMKTAWGSIRVKVKVGNSQWETSIFPDKKGGSYVLPVKAAIRKQESLNADEPVSVTLTLAHF